MPDSHPSLTGFIPLTGGRLPDAAREAVFSGSGLKLIAAAIVGGEKSAHADISLIIPPRVTVAQKTA